MEPDARSFVRRILLVHVLLLLAVLAVVAVAGREIYASARAEAIDQARKQQELLADQTARGIESFYDGVISDLNLLRQTDVENLPPQRPVVTAAREGAFVPFLWNQLRGRVSALFVYNRAARDPERAVHLLDIRKDDATTMPAEEAQRVRALAEASHDWLTSITGPSVSRLVPTAGGGGSNLVCVPVTERQQRLLVAVVPATEIQARFFPRDAMRRSSSATLVDENSAVVTSSSPALSGANLKELDDPDVRALTLQYASSPRRLTMPFERPVAIRGVEIEPRLMTAEPVRVAGGAWCLLISSPMSEVDGVVRDVFATAMQWTAFVALSMTAILVSTAVQMIRSRVRLERIRHAMLTDELEQARRIQLQWLPARGGAGPMLDIAAVNQPANHISGDFYNWFELPDKRQVVMIGDVTGHGMSAAFLMATTQLLVRTTMPRLPDPGQCMTEVNRQLCGQMFSAQFVTMLILVLDLEHGVAETACAGHPPPLLGENDEYKPIPVEPQLVLGIDASTVYPTTRFALPPCSSLLLYTDGAVDVQAAEGDDRFSIESLQKSLYGRFDTAQAVIDAVVNAVNAFRGPRELGDDLTLVAIRTRVPAPGTHLSDAPLERHETVTVTAAATSA